MRGFRRRGPRAAAPGPRVERLDRDLLRVVASDGRSIVVGCESHEGTLTVWLVAGLRWGDGGEVVTAAEWVSIEQQVAEWAGEAGLRVVVDRG